MLPGILDRGSVTLERVDHARELNEAGQVNMHTSEQDYECNRFLVQNISYDIYKPGDNNDDIQNISSFPEK